MGDIKTDFLLNGKNYYELDNSGKLLFDKMFKLLKNDIPEISNCKNCSINFKTDSPNNSFECSSTFPDRIFIKVINAFFVSKNSF